MTKASLFRRKAVPFGVAAIALLGASLLIGDALLQVVLIGGAVVILLALLTLRLKAEPASFKGDSLAVAKALSEREKTEQILTDTQGGDPLCKCSGTISSKSV